MEHGEPIRAITSIKNDFFFPSNSQLPIVPPAACDLEIIYSTDAKSLTAGS